MAGGKIWAEYWIDCAGPCGDHEPLGERDRRSAERVAREKGWRLVGGRWICRKCLTEMANGPSSPASREG